MTQTTKPTTPPTQTSQPHIHVKNNFSNKTRELPTPQTPTYALEHIHKRMNLCHTDATTPQTETPPARRTSRQHQKQVTQRDPTRRKTTHVTTPNRCQRR